MANFKAAMRRAARAKGSVIILANDYEPAPPRDLQKAALRNIGLLHPHISGVKLNLHLLLPLGQREIGRITRAAADRGLVTIADIKLNDIGNTNRVVLENLWDLGFDAVIANPIMGPGGLRALVRHAHRRGKGVITLCHMSAPEARLAYDLGVVPSPNGTRQSRLYRLFLRWALQECVDGVVAGATFPEIIRYCRKTARGRLDIYSPGVGVQGGNPAGIVSAGTDYLIVGRSILGAADPAAEARRIQDAVRAR